MSKTACLPKTSQASPPSGRRKVKHRVEGRARLGEGTTRAQSFAGADWRGHAAQLGGDLEERRVLQVARHVERVEHPLEGQRPMRDGAGRQPLPRPRAARPACRSPAGAAAPPRGCRASPRPGYRGGEAAASCRSPDCRRRCGDGAPGPGSRGAARAGSASRARPARRGPAPARAKNARWIARPRGAAPAVAAGRRAAPARWARARAMRENSRDLKANLALAPRPDAPPDRAGASWAAEAGRGARAARRRRRRGRGRAAPASAPRLGDHVVRHQAEQPGARLLAYEQGPPRRRALEIEGCAACCAERRNAAASRCGAGSASLPPRRAPPRPRRAPPASAARRRA